MATKEIRHSRTEQFLQGRTIPGFTAPIKEVIIAGNKRRVIFADGRSHTMSKQKLTEVYTAAAAAHQAKKMHKTLTPIRGGKVKMRIGGTIEGLEKVYKTRQGAIAALKRKYGVDPTKQKITRNATASKMGSMQRQQDRARMEGNRE